MLQVSDISTASGLRPGCGRVAVNSDESVGVANRSLMPQHARAGDVHPQGIEHAAVALVDVETLIEELSKEPPRLRHAERVGAFAVDR